MPASAAPWPSPGWGAAAGAGEAASPRWEAPGSEAWPRPGAAAGPAVQQGLWRKGRRAGPRSAAG